MFARLKRLAAERGVMLRTDTGVYCFFFQAEDGIRDLTVTGVQTCALPILSGYDGLKTIALVDQLRQRLAGLPGVLGVGSSQIPVLTGTDMGSNITVEGRPNKIGRASCRERV